METGIFTEFWSIEDQLRLFSELRSDDDFNADVQAPANYLWRGGPRPVAVQSCAWLKEWTTTLYQRFDYMGKRHRQQLDCLGSRNQFTFGVGATYSFTTE